MYTIIKSVYHHTYIFTLTDNISTFFFSPIRRIFIMLFLCLFYKNKKVKRKVLFFIIIIWKEFFSCSIRQFRDPFLQQFRIIYEMLLTTKYVFWKFSNWLTSFFKNHNNIFFVSMYLKNLFWFSTYVNVYMYLVYLEWVNPSKKTITQ